MEERARIRGTTLAELLVAVVFIGVCSGVILGSVSSSVNRAAYAKRRALALAYAKNELESVRAATRASTPATGTVSTSPVIDGFGATTTQLRVISTVSGVTGLYSVRVTIVWSERAFGKPRSDSLMVETLMRCPDA